MPAPPLVSVVVPAHNYGHLLGETLATLRAQTSPHWEAVVVDDGSTDDTEAVATRAAADDPRVRYVRQANAGASVARNTGLAHTGGAFVQFLDADDLLEPRKFEAQVAYLDAHPDVGVVYGDVRFFTDGAPGVLRRAMASDDPWMPCVSGTDDVLRALTHANALVVNAPLVRRAVLDAVGPFDPGIRGVEDWDLWLRCALAGVRFAYDDAPGTRALVRAHPSSVSTDRTLMFENGLRLRAKLAAAAAPADILRLNRRLAAAETGQLGLWRAARGDAAGAAARFRRAARTTDRLTFRLRWLACAALARVASADALRAVVETPVRQFPALLRR